MLVAWSREMLAFGSSQYLQFRSTVSLVMSFPVWKSWFLVNAKQDDDGVQSKIKDGAVVQCAPWQLQWRGGIVVGLRNCEEIFFWLLYGEGVVCRSVGTPALIHSWGGGCCVATPWSFFCRSVALPAVVMAQCCWVLHAVCLLFRKCPAF
jgi:hypothetical protein